MLFLNCFISFEKVLFNFITASNLKTQEIIQYILDNSNICGTIEGDINVYIYGSRNNNQNMYGNEKVKEYFNQNKNSLQQNTLISLNTIFTNKLDDPEIQIDCGIDSLCDVIKPKFNQTTPSNNRIIKFIINWYKLTSTSTGSDPDIIEVIKKNFDTKIGDGVIEQILKNKTFPKNNNNSPESQIAYNFVTKSLKKYGGRKTLKLKKQKYITRKTQRHNKKNKSRKINKYIINKSKTRRNNTKRKRTIYNSL